MGTKKWSLCIKQITNLKIAEYFLKRWEFIVAIKFQCYLSILCPITKLHLSGIYFSQNCIKQIIFFNLGYIYHCYFKVIWSDLWQRQSFKISNVPAFALSTTGRVVHYQRRSGLRYYGIAKKPATSFSYFLSYALCLRQ